MRKDVTNMKKKFRAIAAFVLCLVCLSGCKGTDKLSDEYDADELKEAAKEVIELVNAKDYKTLTDTWWSAQMNAVIPAEKMASGIGPVIDELGAFVSFDKEAVTGSTDKDTDLKPAINLGKGQVFQSAVRPDTKLHKLHSPLYKCLHFACVREQEHPGDLVGHGQLRVDCHAQMKIVL